MGRRVGSRAAVLSSFPSRPENGLLVTLEAGLEGSWWTSLATLVGDIGFRVEFVVLGLTVVLILSIDGLRGVVEVDAVVVVVVVVGGIVVS